MDSLVKKNALFLITAILLFLLPNISESSVIYKNSVLTAKHVTIPGTHITIILPEGASLVSSHRGFEAAKAGVTCKVVERAGLPYSESASLLTDKSLEADYIKIIKSERVILNGLQSTLLTCTMTDNSMRGLIIFAVGDDRLTSLLYCYFPAGNTKAEKIIRDSLLSIIFESKQRENSSGNYTLTATGTTLKFAVETNMTRYYTVDGKPISDTIDDASYSSSLIAKALKPEERSKFAESLFASYLSQHEFSICDRRNVTIAGLSGIEMTADIQGVKHRVRTSSGGVVSRVMPGKAYQTLLFDIRSGIIYSFNGIAVRDSANYVNQFRKITDSFKKID